jgi:hypothetical protein
MKRTPPKGAGYGNIYTPHAGSMIISVQRESGLANRTLVLTPRQVRLLRLLTSRAGLVILAVVVLSWAFFATQAVRVPLLQRRLAHMEQNSARLDTLQQALGQLQSRYEQVQHMLGASPAHSASGIAAAPAQTPSTLAAANEAPMELVPAAPAPTVRPRPIRRAVTPAPSASTSAVPPIQPAADSAKPITPLP